MKRIILLVLFVCLGIQVSAAPMPVAAMRNKVVAGGSSYDPDAQAYFDAIVAAGGTIGSSEQTYVNTFVLATKSHSYWTKLIRINLVLGDFTACFVPLKIGGGNAVDTNMNFVSGDYTQVTGLKGNASNKYLKTGITMNNLTPGNFSIGFVGQGMEYNLSGGFYILMGHQKSTANYNNILLVANNSVTRNFSSYDSYFSGPADAIFSSPLQTGFIVGNQASTTDTKIYENAVQKATSSGATGGSYGVSYEIYVFCEGIDGSTTGNFTASTCRGYFIGTALTTGNITDLNTDWEALNDALGRGVQ